MSVVTVPIPDPLEDDPLPDVLLFYSSSSIFSQFHPSRFVIDNTLYTCAEQWMAFSKARFFGDATRESLILASQSPRDHKAHGRKVANFDDARWDAVKFDVVVRGNLAKFTQNKARRDELLRTGDRILAEASPRDCVWGIGLGSGDPRARDPKQWRGRNLLGRALMKVREIIRREEGGGDERENENVEEEEQQKEGRRTNDRQQGQLSDGHGQKKKRKQKQITKKSPQAEEQREQGDGGVTKKSKTKRKRV